MDSGSALRVEKTALKPVIKKTYVLDTNVLLHDPTALTAFKEHQVVIPMTVPRMGSRCPGRVWKGPSALSRSTRTSC